MKNKLLLSTIILSTLATTMGTLSQATDVTQDEQHEVIEVLNEPAEMKEDVVNNAKDEVAPVTMAERAVLQQPKIDNHAFNSQKSGLDMTTSSVIKVTNAKDVKTIKVEASFVTDIKDLTVDALATGSTADNKINGKVANTVFTITNSGEDNIDIDTSYHYSLVKDESKLTAVQHVRFYDADGELMKGSESLSLTGDIKTSNESSNEDKPNEDKQTSSVLAIYVDEEGNKLTNDVLLEGEIGEAYTTEAKKFDGYDLLEIKGEPRGDYTEKQQTVTYIYQLKGEDKQTEGLVNINYVDENGEELANSDTLNGEVGDSFTTEPKAIDGYKVKDMLVNGESVMNHEKDDDSDEKSDNGAIVMGETKEKSDEYYKDNPDEKKDDKSENTVDKETDEFKYGGVYTDDDQTIQYVYEKEAKLGQVDSVGGTNKSASSDTLPQTGSEKIKSGAMLGLGTLLTGTLGYILKRKFI